MSQQIHNFYRQPISEVRYRFLLIRNSVLQHHLHQVLASFMKLNRLLIVLEYDHKLLSRTLIFNLLLIMRIFINHRYRNQVFNQGCLQTPLFNNLHLQNRNLEPPNPRYRLDYFIVFEFFDQHLKCFFQQIFKTIKDVTLHHQKRSNQIDKTIK